MRRRGRRGNSSGSAFPLLVLLPLLFFWETTVKGADAGRLSTLDDTLAAVRDCMVRCPPPWPKAWQSEYLDTIRQAASRDPNVSQYARRLWIVRDGFGPYWELLRKDAERSLFMVYSAEIRWYIENLMATDLQDEEEHQTLRRQYEELADYAMESLLTQFSFLDPNMVRKAKADHLAECRRNIDAPLVPIYRARLSEAPMGQIKQRWHDLRYARVDLWRSLGGHEVTGAKAANKSHPDYLLTLRSLDQLRGQLWSLIPGPPDYYREAVSKEIAASKQRLGAMADARRREERLGVAVWQTEYLSFLLTSLLETAEISQNGAVK